MRLFASEYRMFDKFGDRLVIALSGQYCPLMGVADSPSGDRQDLERHLGRAGSWIDALRFRCIGDRFPRGDFGNKVSVAARQR